MSLQALARRSAASPSRSASQSKGNDVHYELWRIFSWYCLASKSSYIDQMPNISFLHFLRDCRLVDHAAAPFSRLDTDLAFIKETRMCAHTDALCAVPIPRAPEHSDAAHCLPSPAVQHAQRQRVNRTMPVGSPVHRFAASATASVEHAAHAAQIGNAPLVVGRFAGGVATGSTLGGVPSAVLLSPRRRPSQSPSAALVSRQTPVLTVQPSTADLLASGGSHDGAPIALGGSISKRLTFESFLAVLLRLANQRADILRAAQSRQQQQPPPSTQSALLSLLNAHVLPFAARWGFDAAHDEALGAADVQATLLYYRPFLARAYAIYATTERSNFLTYLGMQQFCSEFGIVEGMHLTQHEIGVAFLRCKGRQAHTSQLSHTRARLSLDEFGECIARVAMLGLGRQHPTAAGPLDLVKGMFMLVSQAMLRPRVGTLLHMNFDDARSGAVQTLHRLFRDLWQRDHRRNYLALAGDDGGHNVNRAADAEPSAELQCLAMALMLDAAGGGVRASDAPADVLYRLTHQLGSPASLSPPTSPSGSRSASSSSLLGPLSASASASSLPRSTLSRGASLSAFVSSRPNSSSPSPSSAALLHSVSSAAAQMDDSTDAFRSIELALAGCEALDDLPMAVGLQPSYRVDADADADAGDAEGPRRLLPCDSASGYGADGNTHALLSPTSSTASLWRAARVSTTFAAPPLNSAALTSIPSASSTLRASVSVRPPQRPLQPQQKHQLGQQQPHQSGQPRQQQPQQPSSLGTSGASSTGAIPDLFRKDYTAGFELPAWAQPLTADALRLADADSIGDLATWALHGAEPVSSAAASSPLPALLSSSAPASASAAAPSPMPRAIDRSIDHLWSAYAAATANQTPRQQSTSASASASTSAPDEEDPLYALFSETVDLHDELLQAATAMTDTERQTAITEYLNAFVARTRGGRSALASPSPASASAASEAASLAHAPASAAAPSSLSSSSSSVSSPLPPRLSSSMSASQLIGDDTNAAHNRRSLRASVSSAALLSSALSSSPARASVSHPAASSSSSPLSISSLASPTAVASARRQPSTASLGGLASVSELSGHSPLLQPSARSHVPAPLVTGDPFDDRIYSGVAAVQPAARSLLSPSGSGSAARRLASTSTDSPRYSISNRVATAHAAVSS